MELRIDINDPREIGQALTILNALAVALRDAQAERLRPTTPAGIDPDPPPGPLPQAASAPAVKLPDPQTAASPSSHADMAAADPYMDPAGSEPDEPDDQGPSGETTAEAVVRRGPGRKPDTPEVKAAKAQAKAEREAAERAAKGLAPKEKAPTPKEAAAAPVGAALRGMPAHNLAAALNGSAPHPTAPAEPAPPPAPAPAPTPAVTLHTDPNVPAAEAAAVQHALNGNGAAPVDDPDIADLLHPPAAPVEAPAAPVDAAALFTDDDLFPPAAPPPPPPAPPTSEFDSMTTAQLDLAWRAEGSKRGIHWLRSAIEKYNIRSAADMSREQLLYILTHPNDFTPPAIA